MNTEEIEFKFTIAEQDIPLIINHPLIKRYAVQEPERNLFENIYLDTSSEDLRQKGYMLRIRQSGDLIVQTLKRESSAVDSSKGLHRRIEWEDELSTPVFDINLLPVEIQTQLEPFRSGLQPMFNSSFNRQTWQLILEDQSHIELAVDQGTITAKNFTLPICEVELELKKGEMKTLEKLTEELQQEVKIIPENTTKAERGYNLYHQSLETE